MPLMLSPTILLPVFINGFDGVPISLSLGVGVDVNSAATLLDTAAFSLPGIARATRFASSSTNTTSGLISRTILPASSALAELIWAVPSK